ncbi:MAG TPA: helix-turn-helix domain-containing protein [Vicinamibacterales bacterium]|nr:helix-turn-helix domain-containing protein [Vicinamibacterales bacterium]
MAEKSIIAGIAPRPSRPERQHLVAIVAFDGVVLGDLAAPCEVFARVRDRDGHPAYDVRVCGVRSTAASAHVNLTVRWPLTTLRKADTIVVPGIDDLERSIPEVLLTELRRAIARGARVASICTGAFVLARTGALDGRIATTHWRAASELARRFPAITVDPDVLYVDHGAVLTSAGAAAGLDLCLHLVRRDCGAEIAAQVARAAVMPMERAGGQAQFIVHERPDLPHSTFGPLLIWIEQHLRNDLSLPVVARHAAMSCRTLSRRFREHVGMTPAAWIARARVREAQRLLETTKLSVEAVAERAGYGSATVLRDRFAVVVGVSPSTYRRSFSSLRASAPAAPSTRVPGPPRHQSLRRHSMRAGTRHCKSG